MLSETGGYSSKMCKLKFATVIDRHKLVLLLLFFDDSHPYNLL